MDFFKQIQKPAEFEAEVVEKRNVRKGFRHTEETKQKISEANAGKRFEGKTNKQWAEELGVITETIGVHLKKYGHLDNVGLEPIGRPPILHNDKTYNQLAEELGCSRITVRSHLKKYGHLDNVLKNLNRIQNNTVKQLAAEFGVSYTTIRNHLKKYGNLDKLIAKKG